MKPPQFLSREGIVRRDETASPRFRAGPPRDDLTLYDYGARGVLHVALVVLNHGFPADLTLCGRPRPTR